MGGGKKGSLPFSLQSLLVAPNSHHLARHDETAE
jgi:hypothetical protein